MRGRLPKGARTGDECLKELDAKPSGERQSAWIECDLGTTHDETGDRVIVISRARAIGLGRIQPKVEAAAPSGRLAAARMSLAAMA